MKIKDFGVEMWMNKYENNCVYNLAETCVESLTVEELLNIAGNKEEVIKDILNIQLTYGDIEGSIRLREGITKLYEGINVENIVITHGATGANSLVIETLIEPGDRVISVIPTYQQHYSIPESLGADVKLVQLKFENNFMPEIDELKSFVNDNTKLICINNPNNPTGSLMDKELLMKIVELARECGAYILCDEVYRGLDHEGCGFTESIADLYEKGISTSGMSKVFSLAGLRLGWIAGPKDFIQNVCKHRDYNTISCGKIDDRLAAIALENIDAIIERNHNIVRSNIKILDKWVNEEPRITYVKPKSGTIAFLKYDFDMCSEEFCIRLLEEKGVMLVPGSALDMDGYLRIGYAFNPQVIEDGLKKISEFIRNLEQEI